MARIYKDPMRQPDRTAMEQVQAELAPAIDKETGKPRCTASARTSGARCKQPPVAGTTVCVYHGGKAPQVRKKAALRLLSLVDPAIATLARVMATGDRDADKLRAAENILDRVGYPRRVEVDAETAKEQLLFRLEQARAARLAELADDDN